MGLPRFRRGEEFAWTAGEATDLIGANKPSANDDYYDQRLRA